MATLAPCLESGFLHFVAGPSVGSMLRESRRLLTHLKISPRASRPDLLPRSSSCRWPAAANAFIPPKANPPRGRRRDGGGTEEGRSRDGAGTEQGRRRDGAEFVTRTVAFLSVGQRSSAARNRMPPYPGRRGTPAKNFRLGAKSRNRLPNKGLDLISFLRSPVSPLPHVDG